MEKSEKIMLAGNLKASAKFGASLVEGAINQIREVNSFPFLFFIAAGQSDEVEFNHIFNRDSCNQISRLGV